MSSVDYKFWAKYIKEIHQTIGSTEDIALELASGNCKLAKYLTNEFAELYLTDLSHNMLKYNKSEYKTICCNMLNLPFKTKFDFIFSAFDSINYLSTESELNQFFKKIPDYLTDNGFFLFDVSLMNNSLKYEKDLNREGKFENLEYKQISNINEEKQIHTNIITIQLEDGTIIKEEHKQKIYDFYYYFEVMESAGLIVSECFNAFSFNDGNPDSDRVQFIVKRKS